MIEETEKCEFWKKCKWYNKKSKTCNEEEGFYGSNYAGCHKTLEREVKMKQEKKASKILGILSIIFGVIIPIVGLVLGIIGLCIPKSLKHRERDIALNVIGIGIAVSIFFWVIYIYIASIW